MKTLLLYLTISLFTPPDTITAHQAKHHIGKTVWLKTHVVEFRAGHHQSPDYLNVEAKYPKNPIQMPIFDAVAFKQKVGYTPQNLVGKTILCHAKITQYNGNPQIKQNDIKKITIL
jgi:hypothetical protein